MNSYVKLFTVCQFLPYKKLEEDINDYISNCDTAVRVTSISSFAVNDDNRVSVLVAFEKI